MVKILMRSSMSRTIRLWMSIQNLLPTSQPQLINEIAFSADKQSDGMRACKGKKSKIEDED
jgi:hypothetical protein